MLVYNIGTVCFVLIKVVHVKMSMISSMEPIHGKKE